VYLSLLAAKLLSFVSHESSMFIHFRCSLVVMIVYGLPLSCVTLYLARACLHIRWDYGPLLSASTILSFLLHASSWFPSICFFKRGPSSSVFGKDSRPILLKYLKFWNKISFCSYPLYFNWFHNELKLATSP